MSRWMPDDGTDCWFDEPLQGDRRSWAVPPGHGTYHGLDLGLLDPDNEDELTFLVEAQHPEMAEALERHEEMTGADGEPMNPTLHVTLHQMVANQLLADDPPETWQTVQRLAGLGYDWHNVMHLIMGPVTEAVYETMAEKRPFNRADYVRRLAELPGDWPPPEQLNPQRLPPESAARTFVRLANCKGAVLEELRMAEPAGAAAEIAEGATVGAVLTVLRMSRVMERIDAGVSPQQYRMLKLIGAGGERSARLAERLTVAKPTLTSIADSLVGAGLVCREAEPGDRRVVRLHLTQAGQAAVARADEAYAGWLDDLLEYTGRKDQILASLQLLDESMTERRRARRPAGGTSAGQQ